MSRILVTAFLLLLMSVFTTNEAAAIAPPLDPEVEQDNEIGIALEVPGECKNVGDTYTLTLTTTTQADAVYNAAVTWTLSQFVSIVSIEEHRYEDCTVDGVTVSCTILSIPGSRVVVTNIVVQVTEAQQQVHSVSVAAGSDTTTGDNTTGGTVEKCQTLGVIAGTVFEDKNADGARDVLADNPIQVTGMTVTLGGPGGDQTGNVADDGTYRFEGLPEGDYTVTANMPVVTNPGGWHVSNPETGVHASFHLNEGQQILDKDFLVWQGGHIDIAVFEDHLADGSLTFGSADPNEDDSPQQEVIVERYEQCGSSLSEERSSGANGVAGFSDLRPGDHCFQARLPQGFPGLATRQLKVSSSTGKPGAPIAQSIEAGQTLAALNGSGDGAPAVQERTVLVFTTAIVSGRKLGDRNGDSQYDESDGDSPVPDWVVSIQSGYGTQQQAFVTGTLTDANGNYSMEIDPGSYHVVEADGGDDWAPVAGIAVPIQVTSGSNSDSIDFINRALHADIALSKTVVGESEVNLLDIVEFQIEVSNLGPAVAAVVNVSDTIPEGHNLLSIEASEAFCSTSGRTGTCTFGMIRVGESKTIQVKLAAAELGSFVNEAEASHQGEDRTELNNRDSASFEVKDTGSISGILFHDLNADGIINDGGAVLSNHKLLVSGFEVITDGSGNYSRSGLNEGEHDVSVLNSPDDVFSELSKNVTVSLGEGEHKEGVNFLVWKPGSLRIPTFHLTGYKVEVEFNEVLPQYEPIEAPLLFFESCGLVGVEITSAMSANGMFSAVIADLKPGKHCFAVNFQRAFPGAPGRPILEHNPLSTELSHYDFVTSGDEKEVRGLEIYTTATLTGTVRVDANGGTGGWQGTDSVPNQPVTIRGGRGQYFFEGYSDADGRFSVQLDPIKNWGDGVRVFVGSLQSAFRAQIPEKTVFLAGSNQTTTYDPIVYPASQSADLSTKTVLDVQQMIENIPNRVSFYVGNSGPADAQQAELTIELPEGFELGILEADEGACDVGNDSMNCDGLDLRIGDLDPELNDGSGSPSLDDVDGPTMLATKSSSADCTIDGQIASCVFESIPDSTYGVISLEFTPRTSGQATIQAGVTTDTEDFITSNNDVTLEIPHVSGVDVEYVTEVLPDSPELGAVYPNPAFTSPRIRFSVAKSADVDIRLYDLLGKELQVVASEVMQPGTFDADIETDQLPAGQYMVRVRIGSQVYSTGFAVIR